MNKYRRLIAMLIGCLSLNVSAEIYKCTHANGKTQYSDKPCSGKTTIFIPRSVPKTSQTPQTREQRREKTRRLLDAYQAERAQEKQVAAAARETREQRRKQCLQARDYYRNVLEAGVIYDLDDAGNRIVMNDTARAQEAAWAKSEVEKWCDPPGR